MSNRFIRTDQPEQTQARKPQPGIPTEGSNGANGQEISIGITGSRIYGSRVSVGEPLHLEGDPDFRRDVETSLTAMAKARLLEVEMQAESILHEARAQAAQIILEAQEKVRIEAEDIIQGARNEEASIQDAARENGFKEGYEEGYSDGRQQAQDEAVNLMIGAQQLVEGAYLAEKRVLHDFEQHAMDLISHVLDKILGDHLNESPETILHLIEQAVESLYMSGKVKIVLSAHMLHEIRAFSLKSDEAVTLMNRFEFVADPLLDAHQVYIIGQEGRYDLTASHQTRQLLAPVAQKLQLPRESIATEQDEPEAIHSVLPSTHNPDFLTSTGSEPESDMFQVEIIEADNLAEENPYARAALELDDEP